MGKCGYSHQGPTGQKAAFCAAVSKTCKLTDPLHLKNWAFWTDTPSGHEAAESGRRRQRSPAPSSDEDDGSGSGGGDQ